MGRKAQKAQHQLPSALRSTKIYQITLDGEQVWRQATLQALARLTSTYTNLLMGTHNLWNIPPGESELVFSRA